MRLLPEASPLGRLKIAEVYDYYDGPKLFAAQNSIGALFLVFWADETPQETIWLYLPVSENRLEAIKSGMIRLRAAFTHPEDGFVHVVRIPEGSGASDVTTGAPSMLDLEWLPPEEDALTVPAEVVDEAPQQASHLSHKVHWLRIRRTKPNVAVSLDSVTAVLKAWRQLFNDALSSFGIQTPLIPAEASSGSFRIALAIDRPEVTRRVLEAISQVQGSAHEPASLAEAREHGINAHALRDLFSVLADHAVHLSVELGEGSPVIEFSPSRTAAIEIAFRAAVRVRLDTDEVPQADELSRIFRLLELKEAARDITAESLGVVPRQLAYYKHAARLLGYLNSENELTDAGNQAALLSAADRLRTTVVQFERSRCGFEWIRWRGGTTLLDVSEDSAEDFLTSTSELGPTTAKRRSQTLRAWHRTLLPYHYRAQNRQ